MINRLVPVHLMKVTMDKLALWLLEVIIFIPLWLCVVIFPGAAKKGKGVPYSITERRVPELIPVLGSQPAGAVSHKPGGRLPSLSTRPAVTLTTLKKATNFAVR